MAERQRALPVWMAKKEEKVKEKRKRKAARAAFYCMNEQELVEAAVSYLTNSSCEDVHLLTHQQGEQRATDATKKRENPTIPHQTVKAVTVEDSSSDCTEDLEMTYVSETDLDITEVETVPYTESPRHTGSEDRLSKPVQHCDALMDVDVETGRGREPSQTPANAAEDNDALQLVRDIFFT